MVDAADLLARCEAAALGAHGISRDEALALSASPVALSDLLDVADRVRQARRGARASFCAIVSARSGACANDCRFCAQSAHSKTLSPVHPLMSAEEILAAAGKMTDSGATHFGIVTSGPRMSDGELDVVCEAVRRMQGETGLSPCASLGRLSAEQFARLRQAGLSRYHHNLETSRGFYATICSTQAWDERVATVRRAQDAGLAVCCGGLFNLGESWDDRIDLALTLRDLGVDSVPLNFLNPVAGTPLGGRSPLPAAEALRIIALYRLLLPDACLRICGGRPVTFGGQQDQIFRAGADALMTGNYLTTPGLSPDADRDLVKRLGLDLAARPL